MGTTPLRLTKEFRTLSSFTAPNAETAVLLTNPNGHPIFYELGNDNTVLPTVDWNDVNPIPPYGSVPITLDPNEVVFMTGEVGSKGNIVT